MIISFYHSIILVDISAYLSENQSNQACYDRLFE